MAKCIGANGRKRRGRLRNSPRAVLEKLAGVLGVLVREEQKRRRLTKDKRRRLTKEKLWDVVCKKAAEELSTQKKRDRSQFSQSTQ